MTRFFFFLVGAIPAANESSQARGQIRATAVAYITATATPDQAKSATYTRAHGNALFPTHRARPGIEPASSWILVRFISIAPKWEFPSMANFLCLGSHQTLLVQLLHLLMFVQSHL